MPGEIVKFYIFLLTKYSEVSIEEILPVFDY